MLVKRFCAGIGTKSASKSLFGFLPLRMTTKGFASPKATTNQLYIDPMPPKWYSGVMADVKIRNLDQKVVEAYKGRAKAAGHSLEAELRLALSDQLIQNREALLLDLDKVRLALPPALAGVPSSKETLEAIRQAMAGQRD
jgi:plasmid stability protein